MFFLDEIGNILAKSTVKGWIHLSSSLPSGIAVAEYILEARPENTATDIIFLRSRPPYDPLKVRHFNCKDGFKVKAAE